MEKRIDLDTQPCSRHDLSWRAANKGTKREGSEPQSANKMFEACTDRVAVHAHIWFVAFGMVPAHADPSCLVGLNANTHDASFNVIAADAAL